MFGLFNPKSSSRIPIYNSPSKENPGGGHEIRLEGNIGNADAWCLPSTTELNPLQRWVLSLQAWCPHHLPGLCARVRMRLSCVQLTGTPGVELKPPREKQVSLPRVSRWQCLLSFPVWPHEGQRFQPRLTFSLNAGFLLRKTESGDTYSRRV